MTVPEKDREEIIALLGKWSKPANVAIIDMDMVINNTYGLYENNNQRSVLQLLITRVLGEEFGLSAGDPLVRWPATALSGLIDHVIKNPGRCYDVGRQYRTALGIMFDEGRLELGPYLACIDDNFEAVMRVCGMFLDYTTPLKPNTGFASVDTAIRLQVH